MFDQSFEAFDVVVVGILVILEGVLSIDNALVLGLLAKRLPVRERPRALTYGLVGAFVFRLISIATAQLLLKYWVVKLVGGGYLFYVAVQYFFEQWRARHSNDSDESSEKEFCSDGERIEKRKAAFWPTVFVIELTDIAFAVDSILAAIALVGAPPAGHTGWHPKLWVVMTGGMLGVILMRYAAVIFIKLLERFPRFETAAYLLVFVIGGKLVLDWAFNKPPMIADVANPAKLVPDPNFHGPLDFHSPASLAFWVFWVLMIVCFCIGFIPPKKCSGDSDGDQLEQPASQDAVPETLSD